jgi:hypothetical protein
LIHFIFLCHFSFYWTCETNWNWQSTQI